MTMRSVGTVGIRNKGGRANEIAARITDRLLATGEIKTSKRKPLSDRIKSRMVQRLKSRGKWLSSHCPDHMLIGFMRSTKGTRCCPNCEGKGIKNSSDDSLSKFCQVCNGRGVVSSQPPQQLNDQP